MQSFYTLFLFSGLKCNTEDVKPYYLSEPYFEPYSKAMMLSVGQITNTALLSFDVKLRDFVEDITYFETGAHQVRALLVDKRGTLWMHKNFPRMETIVEQPLKVYLHDLENLDEKTMIGTRYERLSSLLYHRYGSSRFLNNSIVSLEWLINPRVWWK